jgi:hypothetical protein
VPSRFAYELYFRLHLHLEESNQSSNACRNRNGYPKICVESLPITRQNLVESLPITRQNLVHVRTYSVETIVPEQEVITNFKTEHFIDIFSNRSRASDFPLRFYAKYSHKFSGIYRSITLQNYPLLASFSIEVCSIRSWFLSRCGARFNFMFCSRKFVSFRSFFRQASKYIHNTISFIFIHSFH